MFHKLDSTCFYVIREINFQEVDQGNKKRSRHISLKHKMQEKKLELPLVIRVFASSSLTESMFMISLESIESNSMISLEWNLAILGH